MLLRFPREWLMGFAESEVGIRVRQVGEMIARSAEKVRRDPHSVQLVAVCKTVEVTRIRLALEAGVNSLGENRVQEGQAKRPELKGYAFQYHLIGPLQRNKVNKALDVFDWVETVDSIELARKLDVACRNQAKILPILVQVKLAEEPTKAGLVEPQLLDFLQEISEFRGLSIRGLMTVPPFFDAPEDARPYFRQLRLLAERVKARNIPNVEMKELSMGMSHDFHVAIEEGATIVRIGTAIFGTRPSIDRG
ncbi:MAG: YggS family pyridoxal phosphate-dependent enzyme [Acidobacteriota bacterium]